MKTRHDVNWKRVEAADSYGQFSSLQAYKPSGLV